MKKLKKILSVIFLTLLSLSVIFLMSCKKDNDTDKDNNKDNPTPGVKSEVTLLSLYASEPTTVSVSALDNNESSDKNEFVETPNIDIEKQYIVIYKSENVINLTIKLSNPNNYYIMDFKLSCEQENVLVHQGSHWSNINDSDTYIRWDEGSNRLGNREATFELKLPDEEISPDVIRVDNLYYSDRTDGSNKTAVNTNNKETYTIYKIEKLFEITEKTVNNVEAKIKLNVSDTVSELKFTVDGTEYNVGEDGYYHVPGGDLTIAGKYTVNGLNEVLTKTITGKITLINVEVAYVEHTDLSPDTMNIESAWDYWGKSNNIAAIFIKVYETLGYQPKINLYKENGDSYAVTYEIYPYNGNRCDINNEAIPYYIHIIGENIYIFDYSEIVFFFDGFEIKYPLNVYPTETTIVIPDGTTTIADFIFANYINLTNITIPDSVTSIGYHAFYDCDKLTNIHISSIESWCKITGIGNLMGYSSSNKKLYINGEEITELIIPDSITSIENVAFSNCSGLKNVTIPEGVTSIGESAFSRCSGLKNVTIPEGVTSIGYRAFSGCSGLTSIIIPDSVTSIRYYAFDGTAWYNNQPDGLIYAGKVAYKYKGTMPNNTTIVINEGTISIGDYAFSGCTGLTSIIIPDSVTSIGTGAFDGTAWYNNQPDGLIYAGKVAYIYKGTMPNNTTITIKEGTIGIANSAFDYYFSGPRELTSIIIPHSVTSIGDYAFYYCSKLKNITFKGTMEEWNAIRKGSDWNFKVPSDCVIHCSDGDITIN